MPTARPGSSRCSASAAARAGAEVALRRVLPALIILALFAGAAAGASGRSHRTPACPRHDRQPLVSRAPGASAVLVPGQPQAVLLCRYSGLQGPRARWQRLLRQRLVRQRARVGRLASELNALPPVNGVQACPLDNGSAIVAIFRYRSGPDDPVTVRLTGCRLTTNGYVHREAGSIADELRRLVR